MNDLLPKMQMTDGEPTFRPAIGLLADFTVDGGSYPKKAAKAAFEWIDPQRLLDFFRERDARLNIKVPNTLSADGSLLHVCLRFSNPGDFGELNIASEIPALKALDRCRQVVDKYLGEGLVRSVARWILAAPDITFAARNPSASMQTRFGCSSRATQAAHRGAGRCH
jgi:type VI secretion system (T6SS) VipA/Hcp2 family protein